MKRGKRHGDRKLGGGEEGHGCHGVLVRMPGLPWRREGNARAVGVQSHHPASGTLEEEGCHKPSADHTSSRWGVEKKEGQEGGEEAGGKLRLFKKKKEENKEVSKRSGLANTKLV